MRAINNKKEMNKDLLILYQKKLQDNCYMPIRLKKNLMTHIETLTSPQNVTCNAVKAASEKWPFRNYILKQKPTNVEKIALE